MSSQDTIVDELRSLGSGLPVSDSPSFSVPEGYFEGLAAAILTKVKSSERSEAEAELNELSPLLAGIPKTTPYSVPSLYFTENLQSIMPAEADLQSPVLASINKAMPYDVPVNYFNDLPAQVLAKASKPEAKVVPMFRRSWAKMAAAAVIAGGLVFGGLQIFGNKQQPDGLANGTIKNTATQIAQNKAPVIQEIKKASTTDLEEFMKSVPATVAAPKKKPASKEETKELLKDVSVNEMETFLAAVPPADDELAATDEP